MDKRFFTGDRMSFDAVCNLKIGDRFFEVDYGRKIDVVVTSLPVLNGEKLTFSGVDESGRDIEYLLNSALQHYNPKIYAPDQIIYLEDVRNQCPRKSMI